MKTKIISIAVATLILTISISCSNQKTTPSTDNDMYNHMIEYSQHYAEIQDHILLSTRSGEIVLDTLLITDVDLNKINPTFLEYFDYYIQPEDFTAWNEKEVLSKIENDSRFSDEDKLMFTKILAGIYYYKTNLVAHFQTRSSATPEEQQKACEKVFHLSVAKATRDFIIAMGGAILLDPTPLGEAAACFWYYSRITEAEIEYNLCMKAIEDHEELDDLYFEDDDSDDYEP